MANEQGNLRLIKKYPNRRLYDTHTSSYVTTDFVRQLVIAGENVQIIDNTSGKDLTRGIFMQIINELEEHNHNQMFSNDFLAQVIKSYGSEMQNTLVLCFNKTLDLYMTHMKSDKAQQDHPRKMAPNDYFNTIARDNINRWQRSWENLKNK